MTNLIDALDDILDRQPASALLGTTSESRISASFSTGAWPGGSHQTVLCAL